MKNKDVLFLLVSLSMMGTPHLYAEPPSGRDLYQKKICFACHGKDGQGGGAGPSLKGLGKNKTEIIAFLKKGSAKMRPVKATDEELSALADYLLTLK